MALNWTRRIEDQHCYTGSAPLANRKNALSLPPMGAGRPYPACLLEKKSYIVDFNGAHDLVHPSNWPMRTKLAVEAKAQASDSLTRIGRY
ncbi:hypothetical protein V8C35DRAFT_315713 [Trichoderma chlorosporum]